MRYYKIMLTSKKGLTSVKRMKAKNRKNLAKAIKRKYPNSKINSIKNVKKK